ncbi:CBS domain-containing protein [Pseudonocardia eucalypti]|nr:CBS domain-containing protein [Pseudonocardia eucalypti]
MSHPVLVAEESWRIEDAGRLLAKYGYTAMPVIDDHQRLVGIVSDSDLLTDPLAGRPLSRPRTVGGVMSTDVRFVYDDTPLDLVEHQMITAGVRVMPVISHGRLVGVISRRDLLRVLHRRRATSADPRLPAGEQQAAS